MNQKCSEGHPVKASSDHERKSILYLREILWTSSVDPVNIQCRSSVDPVISQVPLCFLSCVSHADLSMCSSQLLYPKAGVEGGGEQVAYGGIGDEDTDLPDSIGCYLVGVVEEGAWFN